MLRQREKVQPGALTEAEIGDLEVGDAVAAAVEAITVEADVAAVMAVADGTSPIV